MKTSNKLLLIAVLTVLCYCVASAFALKREFLKGEYKSRFYGMTKLNLANFDAIEADISNSNITVERGDKFAVWVKNDTREIVVKQKNKTLLVSYLETDKSSHGYGSSIIIICPELASLKLGKTLSLKQRMDISLDPSKIDVSGAFNTIKGFKQTAMTVEINNATTVQLQEIGIGKFNGISNWGKLNVTGPNKIDTANFEIHTHSLLTLDNAEINHPNYKIDGPAKVSVSGNSLHLLVSQ